MADLREKTEEELRRSGLDIEIPMEVGRMLMKSGAETYRVEETMNYVAKSLGIEHFVAYVLNRGIFASGTNEQGVKESRVMTVPDTVHNMRKIEEVNTLSRSLSREHRIPKEEIFRRLDDIDKVKGYGFIWILLAYFFGAFGFGMALGVPFYDSVISGLAGLCLGVVSYFLTRFIRTGFIMTILGSCVVTLSVNVMVYLGLNAYPSRLMIGALMLLVPGAFFTNSVRELSQNNYLVGTSLLLAALLTCISMSVGVAATSEVLPFAMQMGEAEVMEIQGLILKAICAVAAGIGTVSFALLYQVHFKYFWDIGIIGSVSWLIYLMIEELSGMDTMAVLFSAVFTAFFSRYLAAKRKCPTTIFLSTSLFPLIPGIGVYKAIYYLITGNGALSLKYGRSCFLTAFTIAIAIGIVQQIPQAFFQKK